MCVAKVIWWHAFVSHLGMFSKIEWHLFNDYWCQQWIISCRLTWYELVSCQGSAFPSGLVRSYLDFLLFYDYLLRVLSPFKTIAKASRTSGILRLQLHDTIYRPDSFVLVVCYCADLKAIRYESTILNRIVADKSHRVIVAWAMFTLYRISFCSVSKVDLIQCEQKLMFCCGAEIVPKSSQCEHKPYPSYNLQRSLLISKDQLPVRGSVAISAPIKCSDLTRTVSKTDPIRNVPLSTGELSSFVPEQKLLRKQRS